MRGHARLPHVVPRAGSADLEHALLVVVPADRDDRELGVAREDRAGCLDPVHLGHLDVDDDGVGILGADELDAFRAVACDCGDLEPRIALDHGLECGDVLLVVLRDDDPVGAVRPQNGAQGSPETGNEWPS